MRIGLPSVLDLDVWRNRDGGRRRAGATPYPCRETSWQRRARRRASSLLLRARFSSPSRRQLLTSPKTCSIATPGIATLSRLFQPRHESRATRRRTLSLESRRLASGSRYTPVRSADLLYSTIARFDFVTKRATPAPEKPERLNGFWLSPSRVTTWQCRWARPS